MHSFEIANFAPPGAEVERGRASGDKLEDEPTSSLSQWSVLFDASVVHIFGIIRLLWIFVAGACGEILRLRPPTFIWIICFIN